MGSVETQSVPVEYGKPAQDLFLFEPGYRNLNNGERTLKTVAPTHLPQTSRTSKVSID